MRAVLLYSVMKECVLKTDPIVGGQVHELAVRVAPDQTRCRAIVHVDVC